ncbi:PIN domain-containing protein [Streptomyces albireticuli]|uniref:PIN domain-containing protein n=1 Tax=Streptomyces albireticuli TaxID=1940 RepID=A0A2A2D315_9ACTN|nr:PIN domain-containing protein [Streptomyces albireticuli]MCD9146037.1 PIN domain-containing protein [Streptomyces albireticuli]MCD9165818.1 PIN domain-containing protein [Streptomyces albireticuli]MCD9196035.1 PIN domain-containing protein [Streptomyces albireticuli]PAU46878.1 hypothetical protein CK936_21470 [Streptomyces albireticuli]
MALGVNALPAAVADTSVLLAAFNSKDHGHVGAVEALMAPRRLWVSQLVMAELDYLLTEKVGARAALDALRRINGLTRIGRVQIAEGGIAVMTEAEGVMEKYPAVGLTDSVNAVLAWKLARPVVLSLDHHYRDVIAPRHRNETRLEVLPESVRRRS